MNKVVLCVLIVIVTVSLVSFFCCWMRYRSFHRKREREYEFNNQFKESSIGLQLGPIYIDYIKQMVKIENVVFKPGHFLDMEIRNRKYDIPILTKDIKPVLKIHMHSITHPTYSINFKYWQDAEDFLSNFEQAISKAKRGVNQEV